MVTPSVWIATIESGALHDVLRALTVDLPHVYLESEARVRLAPLADLLVTPIRVEMPAARWSKGRAFGPTLELAWRRVDPLLVAIHALNESGQPPGATLDWTASDWNGQLTVDLKQTRAALLIEPAYNGGRALRCLDYYSGGVIVMTRLCDLVP